MSSAALQAARPWALAVLSDPSSDWDTFVVSSHTSSVYLRSGWTLLAREVFGHRVAFIEARTSAGELLGVLPLVQQKNLLLGNFATSVPFFNYGGGESRDPAVIVAMMDRARELSQQWGCSYLEFRDAQPRSGEWIVRKDKVAMVLALPPTFDALSKQLGSKLRSQVKRTEREEPSIRVGGVDLVDAFYDVFAHNMRDLGTPVYPRKFFTAIIAKFPQLCRLLVVESRGKPVAAAFLVIAGARAEIPWAACLPDAKSLGFNMKLYWEVLRYVIDSKCTEFDFGRSTIDAGTYKFKKQWGAEPQQLYWHRWERDGDVAEAGIPAGQGRLMRHATSIWQKLPLKVANALGPLVSPNLPW
jgi:serine/alanine adding enzyme